MQKSSRDKWDLREIGARESRIWAVEGLSLRSKTTLDEVERSERTAGRTGAIGSVRSGTWADVNIG